MRQENLMKTNENQEVMIGQPLELPVNLMATLSTFFSYIREVKSAYMACIQYPTPNSKPKLLIGLDSSISPQNILALLEKYMSNKPPITHPMQFVDIDETSPFHQYFSSISPFYTL